MPTRPRKTSPPIFGNPLAATGATPPPVSSTATSPHGAYQSYMDAIGRTVPYNVNRAQAATRRIRLVGR